MITLRGKKKTSQSITHEFKNYRGGSNLLLDEARVADNEAVVATNLISVMDGLWKPRWGTDYYGAELPANPDGAAEFVKSDGTTELVCIANGIAQKSTNGSAWTTITGATFTAGIQCYFIQIAGFLYIANGTDTLARYNGSTLVTYSNISTPSGLSGARASGLASGSYNYYAEVTALNEVGETVGSTEASITVNKVRDGWLPTSDGITWSWSTVANATRYQLYISDQSGQEAFLTSTNSLSYLDNGSLFINNYVVPPLVNTTTAPKFKSMVISGNRLWATGNKDDPYAVYYSGAGLNKIGNFAEFYGGGTVWLDRGGNEIPQTVVHYQTGQGVGVATVLCKTPEGHGAVWQITFDSITVGDTTITIPIPIKIIGTWGTEAPLSVVSDGNNIQFANRKGWFGLGPQQNYYGILRTNELSSKIRPYWTSLIGSKISGIAAYYYDAKIFISVPTTTSGNNKVIIWDTERSLWIVDWSFGVKQFFEYTDTTGVTHFMYVPLTGTKLIEISPNIAGDLGVAFSTEYASGRINTAKLWKDFVKIGKVYIKLGSPNGAINFEVSGTKKTLGFKAIATATISPSTSLTGMGWDPMGSVEMGDTEGAPTTYADSSSPFYVTIRKKLRDFKLRLTTSGIDADYVLQGFVVEGKTLTGRPPSGWKILTS
jgi:hypothetical protein